VKKKTTSQTRKLISRRTFVGNAAAGSAFIALGPVTNLFRKDKQQVEQWLAGVTKFRFHMIGNAHIDPVWLWPWSEGISVVYSTFRSALDRMNETPDFCFTASSAQFYQWVSENDPSMLAEIRKRVDEGRWNIVGGWFAHRKWTGNFRPCEIKTLRMNQKTGDIKEVNLLEE
jgi:alpha-mannosidase